MHTIVNNGKSKPYFQRKTNRINAKSIIMYSREEASQIRKTFWTTFGKYIRPIPSADGMKVNWVNYKTGYRGMYFRMDADKKRAIVAVTFEQKDPVLRELFYEQMLELQSYFHNTVEEEWIWEANATDSKGKTYSQVYTKLENVSVFKESDWPELITFFKNRMIALDDFWSMAKHHFEPLA